MNRAGQSADSRCWLHSESQVIVGEVVRGVSSVPSAIRERDRSEVSARTVREIASLQTGEVIGPLTSGFAVLPGR